MLPIRALLMRNPQQVVDIRGALLHKIAGQLLSTGWTTLVWGGEDYDLTGWHDNATNNQLVTVPFGTSGLVRPVGNINMGGDGIFSFEKNTASFYGRGAQDTPASGGSNTFINIASAPIPCSPGDTFQMSGAKEALGTTTRGDENYTWFSVEEIKPGLQRCLMRRASTQAIPATSSTRCSWDTEVYKTNAAFRNASFPTRIYAPFSGYWRAGANVSGGNTISGEVAAWMTINGVVVSGCAGANTDTVSSNDMNNLVSAPIWLNAGDYVEVWIYSNQANTLTADFNSCLWLEEWDSSYQFALASQQASVGITAGTTKTMDWTQVYDTANIFDPAAPTIMTVPPNCNYARPSFSFHGDFASGELSGWCEKNGATFRGTPAQSTNTAGNDSICAFGSWVPCVPGDQFRFRIFSNGARTVPADGRSWFSLECRA